MWRTPEFLDLPYRPHRPKKEIPSVRESFDDALPTPEGETWNRVIVVSNRLPFRVSRDGAGKRSVVTSSGGLVTAMSPLLREGVAGKWIGWPGTEEEEGLEEALRSKPNGQYEVGVVHLTPQEEKQYYQGYSNKVLTPLFEGEMDKVDFENANEHWDVYKHVQKSLLKKYRKICALAISSGYMIIIWLGSVKN